MASVETYLEYRNLFINLNFIDEVLQLDIYYNLSFLYNKDGKLIKILMK